MKIFWTLLSILFVMLLIPFAVFKFVPSDAVLIAILMLFYVIYPLFSVCIGIVSGLSINRMWWISLTLPLCFIASGYFIISMGFDSIIYAVAYFFLSVITMVLTSIIKYNKDRKS